METEKYRSMIEMFPAVELAKAMLHIDRFDPDVVTEERLSAVRRMDEMDSLTEQIVEENL